MGGRPIEKRQAVTYFSLALVCRRFSSNLSLSVSQELHQEMLADLFGILCVRRLGAIQLTEFIS